MQDDARMNSKKGDASTLIMTIIPGILEEEDANNVLIPPRKIVIIMLPTRHSTATEAVEGKDKHPFFARNSSLNKLFIRTGMYVGKKKFRARAFYTKQNSY